MPPRLLKLPPSLRQLCSQADEPALPPSMTLLMCSIVFGVLPFLNLQASAGTAEQAQLLQAQALSNQGEFARAIQILEPLVQDEVAAVDDVSRGTAWNILGPAYEGLGNYPAAWHSYEMAIQLLQKFPVARATYASALTNLGSLETYMGHLEAAEALLRKARRLYVRIEDRTGLVEVATNLAILAFARNDTHAAHRFITRAFEEAERAQGVSDSDRAAMYSVRGSLAAKARDFAAAVGAYQKSIDFWTLARGPKCQYVAFEYTLQADAYRELGRYSEASRDLTAAFALEGETVGRNTEFYVATELSYARLLRATGEITAAEKAEKEAETSFPDFR